jgi:hypothetical protein
VVLSELALVEELAAGRLVPVPVPVADLGLGRSLRAVWAAGRRPAGPARDLPALIRRSTGKEPAASRGSRGRRR